MELASFDWDRSGTENVTYNLALWTIHMLAVLARGVSTFYNPIAEDPDYDIGHRSLEDLEGVQRRCNTHKGRRTTLYAMVQKEESTTIILMAVVINKRQ